MITNTDTSRRIKHTGSQQTVFHIYIYPRILNIHHHRKRTSNTGKHLKTPVKGIGMKNTPTGNIMITDCYLDITKIEIVVKGAGTVPKRGHDHKSTLQR